MDYIKYCLQYLSGTR